MGFFSKLRGLFSGRGATGGEKKTFGGFFSKKRREERKRQRDYERSQRLMDKWEKKEKKRQEKEKARRAEQERKQKEADRAKREAAYGKAYSTFYERYGMSVPEYMALIDVWGGVTQDMKDIFGDSKKGDGSLVYAYKELNENDRKRFPEILQGVMNEIEGQGYNQEQAINKLYDTIDHLNAGGEL